MQERNDTKGEQGLILTPQKMMFDKTRTALRYQIMGRASANPLWFLASQALDLGLEHHTGFRKDGATPEFQHQVAIALHLLTMEKYLRDAPRTIAGALLHDLGEDHSDKISFEEIGERTDRIIEADCRLLAKEYRGVKKTPEAYFEPLAANFRVSVIKGGDRVHNLSTMAGVFNLLKQIAYCDETEEHFFKFLKLARRNFPDQEPIYENLKFTMRTQIKIFRSAHLQGVAA